MKKLWLLFIVVTLASFAVLGWIGTRIYQAKPPIPETVVTTDGTVILTKANIQNGQNVWQAMGGMQVGSVWGHGSYVAPDWTAEWLHRECILILDDFALSDFGKLYEFLDPETQALLQKRLQLTLRKNTYDPTTGAITIHPARARAFVGIESYIVDTFKNGQKAYAIPKNAVTDPQKLHDMSAFFFWTSWAAATNRPNDDVTYTHNWPHEPLVANVATGEAVVWTGVSVIMLLIGVAGLIWWYATRKYHAPENFPQEDPLLGTKATPSQRASLKYFYIVTLLILVQIVMGVIAAHYGVEGDGFYGFPLAQWLPYSVARTWHIQLGLFWIATAWLGAGLFIGPLVSGQDPKFQRLGVNVLFVALLVIVVGSLAGEWMSIQNKMSTTTSFYWGHQGYEYIDLGRIWQIGLMAGLLIWLFLVARCVIPAIKKGGEQKPLLSLFLLASIAIALFYGAGLTWGQHTHLSMVEYWRWWVVHLWVEGFFEVFSTVVIAFFFTRLKLIHPKLAAEAALISATIYLTGGVIGTCHHLYFSGTPTVALAFGSVFSALEVVPLLLIVFAAIQDFALSKTTPWIQNYIWPIYFFLAVSFWNLVGAGIFGFMINPPIALYYMQGLNTTPVHGHTALFGVYGMLGMGLVLFCVRAFQPDKQWNSGLIRVSFWAINIGLLLMVMISLLPVGLMQTWASVKYSYWYARSLEFMQTPLMNTLRWLRVPGDTIFALGALGYVVFIFGVRFNFFVHDQKNPK